MSSQGKEEATAKYEKVCNDILADEKHAELFEFMPVHEAQLAANFLVKKSLFTSKWMLNNMPTTVSNLQNGSLSPVEFTRVLKVTTHFKEQHGEKFQRNIFTINMCDAFQLAYAAIPERFARNAGMTEKDYHALHVHFAVELGEAIDTAELECPRSMIDWSETYKAMVDKVAEQEAEAIDKALFRGKKNTFLRKCPLYKKSAKFIYDLLGSEDRLRASRAVFFNNLMFIAIEITEGTNKAHKTCWECKTKTSKMNRCSCCQVAQYCGKQCQRKAWKAGHQANCAQIKEKYDSLLESLDIVVAEHEKEMLEGCNPAFKCDYHALAFSVSGNRKSWYGPWEGTELEKTVTGPSIVHYFDNLRKVRAGRLWFFPTAKSETKMKPLVGETHDMILHELLMMVLCYDYTGCCLQQEVGGRHIVPIHKSKLYFSEFGRQGMSVERFFELQHRKTEPIGDEKEKAAIVKKYHTETTHAFLKEQLDAA